MNILFIGAHTDDIEHGAGGVLCRLLSKKEHRVKYSSLSLCNNLERNKNIWQDQDSLKRYLLEAGALVSMANIPNRHFPESTKRVRERLEMDRDSFHPDIVFTHWKSDIHQDHKVVADESHRVFRNHTVLGYECIRSCPRFAPNVFALLDREDVQNKMKLLAFYKTQKELYYMGNSITESLAITRGVSVNRPFAEGFDLVRMILGKNPCAL